MSDDPTTHFKVTITTESLTDGSTETTIFDKAEVRVRRINPEPLLADVLSFLETGKPMPPPRVEMSIQPIADEETGDWVHQTSTPPIPKGDDD